MKKRISTFSRVGMLVCAAMLTAVLFVPMWRIELDAPQYPEGLKLQIFPHRLGGDVEIINGLNHYIGMKTLHTEDFREFKILPYIIGIFAVSSIVVSLIGVRKWLNYFLILFVVFGFVAMIDFWWWEYDYGHDLDPHAAIQVPGMAYQPPLIGFKQLLNFGAYSIPDKGGWLFLIAGFLSLFFVLFEWRASKVKINRPVVSAALFLCMLFMQSCKVGPEPLSVGEDQCSFCKMKITEPQFGSEIVTTKGKVFKFDDIACAAEFLNKEKIPKENLFGVYVSNYASGNALLNVEECVFYKCEGFKSPMNGNIAAFADSAQMEKSVKGLIGEQISWKYILNHYK